MSDTQLISHGLRTARAMLYRIDDNALQRPDTADKLLGWYVVGHAVNANTYEFTNLQAAYDKLLGYGPRNRADRCVRLLADAAHKEVLVLVDPANEEAVNMAGHLARDYIGAGHHIDYRAYQQACLGKATKVWDNATLLTRIVLLRNAKVSLARAGGPCPVEAMEHITEACFP